MKERSRRTDADANRESDEAIVPEKSPNKGTPVPAEVMEGRAEAERNAVKKAATRTPRRKVASFGLSGVRKRARQDKECCFTALLHHITPQLLRESFYKLRKDAAKGVDEVDWYEYEAQLEERLPSLHEEIHKGSYRALPAKRTYIDKDNGEKRPISITSVEDKLVQQAVVTVLSQIYEADFLGFSYGFRRERNQHKALDALATAINKRRINWILDADLKKFFDTIPHDELIRLLKIRVGDKRILRLILKWLKTGYSEDGQTHRQSIGIMQGSVISPLLANIYLHYVLDMWVEYERKTKPYGEIIIVRFADDFVLGFQYKQDAIRLLEEMKERLTAFGLTIHPDKTRLIEFGRFAAINRQKRGESKPDTFDFLGFTHICGKNRKGYFLLKRKTKKKTLKKAIRKTTENLRKRMHRPVHETGEWLGSVVRGFGNYFGVPGNSKALKQFRDLAARAWLQTLRRRSQKGRVWNWNKFIPILNAYIPHLQICHPFPEVRFLATTQGRSRMR